MRPRASRSRGSARATPAGRPETQSLIDALGAREGLVCVVGAGGKKTAMRRLAEAHPGRCALTCTAKLLPFQLAVPLRWHVLHAPADADALLEAAAGERVLAFTGPSEDGRRRRGLAPELVAAIHRRAGVDVTLVKADGARMRLLKGRRAEEPPLVPGASTVLNLCSVHAVGRTLDERVAHRPEIVAEVVAAAPGEQLRAEHLARLIAFQHAELRAKSDARLIHVLNMVDDEAYAATARQVAERALEGPAPRPAIVLTCLESDPPRFEVLSR